MSVIEIDKLPYKLALWCTPLSMVVLFFGMWFFGGIIPPPDPLMSAEDVVAFYNSNAVGIKITGILLIITPSLLAPITAVITVIMWKGEGKFAPLALTQLVAGVMTIAPFILTGLCWAIGAFRSDRDPQTTLLIHDLGWISLEMVTPPAMVQLAAIALAIFRYGHKTLIYPRWVAYYSLWTCLLFVPGWLVTFFLDGPFAWDGLLSFWLAAGAYGGWLMVLFVMSLKTVNSPWKSVW